MTMALMLSTVATAANAQQDAFVTNTKKGMNSIRIRFFKNKENGHNKLIPENGS